MKLPAGFVLFGLLLAAVALSVLAPRLAEGPATAISSLESRAPVLVSTVPVPVQPLGEPKPPPGIARIRAAAIALDAPVVVLGLEPDGVMSTPDRPDVVAWYRFSERPGALGNGVFAGH